MNDAAISAPTVSRRTERNAARDRLAYILSFVCIGLGIVWLLIVCGYGYPKWSPTHPAAFKSLPEIERARIVAQRDRDAEQYVLASIAGVTQPLTAGLAAVFLIGIGLAGLVRFPFLSVISTVGLSLWIFGVAFSRPPPKLVDVKEGLSADDPAVQYDDMSSNYPTEKKQWTSRGQGLYEFIVAASMTIVLVFARARIVNGTIRHRRSVAPAAAVAIPSPSSNANAPAPNADASPVISAQSVSRDFTDGEKVRSVLKNATLSVGRGEIIAIVGQSGSGKSTLLHILGLLDTPTGGTVSVKGKNVLELPERERDSIRNRTIGFVFQFFHLMSDFDVLDNVLTSCRIAGDDTESSRQAAISLIEKLGLGDHIHANVGTLSGGERQRVAIARALANKPQVLLCDEPTGNLDNASGRAIMELLLSLRERDGLSLVIVTHDGGLADRADRTYILKDGILAQSEWDAKRDS